MAGGNLIDALDRDIYSTTVKSISVKLLQVITTKDNLEILCGDIGNAYVNAYTNEKSVRHRRRRIWEGNEGEHSHHSAGSLQTAHILRALAHSPSQHAPRFQFQADNIGQRCMDPSTQRRRLLRLHLHTCRQFHGSRKNSATNNG